MLKAARAQGRPITVIAMMTAARTQPAAIYRPPKAIHSRLSNRDKTDIGCLRDFEDDASSLSPPSRLRHARDLDTRAPFARDSPAKRPSRLGAIADQEGVVGVFGDLPPQILVAAVGDHRVIDFLEIGIAGRHLVVEFERGLQARVHHRRRERRQLGAGGDEPFHRRRD